MTKMGMQFRGMWFNVVLMTGWAIIALINVHEVRAEFLVSINANVEQVGPTWRYTYNVSNESTAGEPIYFLQVFVDATSALSNITKPSGWESFYDAGADHVQFLGDDTGLTDILPGQSGVFSFLSELPPGNYPADVIGENKIGGIEQYGVLVSAPGPGFPVPEPSSLYVAIIGLASVIFGVVWHRRSRVA